MKIHIKVKLFVSSADANPRPREIRLAGYGHHLLAKIVKMEAEFRAAKVELDTDGMMVENKRGTQIPNPLISVIDTLERRQLAVIRSMSLNQTASDPRTINGTAKVEDKARVALKTVSFEGLIAQPAH